MGYDTIYGVQDMKDDEIIGIKSTAIKFKKNIKLFVGIMLFDINFNFLFHKELGLNISLHYYLLIFFKFSLSNQKFDKRKARMIV